MSRWLASAGGAVVAVLFCCMEVFGAGQEPVLEGKGSSLSAAVLRVPPATPASGKGYVDAVTGMEFVFVPGGCFQMGSPSSEKDRNKNEGPVHEVCVDGFYLGKHEVTVAEFMSFVKSTGYRTEAEQGEGCYVNQNGLWDSVPGKSWRDPNFSQSPKDPVVCVSWNDTQAFIVWLSHESGKRFRLPTEAEWEYAARAGTSTSRYWGDDPDKACLYGNVYDKTSHKLNKFDWLEHNCDDGYTATAPVGSFKPNEYGLYDMLGNVWEWCSNYHQDDYFKNSPRQNPKGPLTSGSSLRVLRGAGWDDGPVSTRAASRGGGYRPGNSNHSFGFRLLLSTF